MSQLLDTHLKDDVMRKRVFDAADDVLRLWLSQLNRTVRRLEQRPEVCQPWHWRQLFCHTPHSQTDRQTDRQWQAADGRSTTSHYTWMHETPNWYQLTSCQLKITLLHNKQVMSTVSMHTCTLWSTV